MVRLGISVVGLDLPDELLIGSRRHAARPADPGHLGLEDISREVDLQVPLRHRLVEVGHEHRPAGRGQRKNLFQHVPGGDADELLSVV